MLERFRHTLIGKWAGKNWASYLVQFLGWACCVMRIKIASLVLFTAWFSAHALAQWDWQSYSPPPPPLPPPSSLDQPDFLSSPPPPQRQSRPANRERLRPAGSRSTQSDARQGTVEEQKPRQEIQTKGRKHLP